MSEEHSGSGAAVAGVSSAVASLGAESPSRPRHSAPLEVIDVEASDAATPGTSDRVRPVGAAESKEGGSSWAPATHHGLPKRSTLVEDARACIRVGDAAGLKQALRVLVTEAAQQDPVRSMLREVMERYTDMVAQGGTAEKVEDPDVAAVVFATPGAAARKAKYRSLTMAQKAAVARHRADTMAARQATKDFEHYFSDASRRVRLEEAVLGTADGGEGSLLLSALLYRERDCVEALLRFYPVADGPDAQGLWRALCPVNVADRPEVMRQAIDWGDADVIRLVIGSTQGVRFVDTRQRTDRLCVHAVRGGRHGVRLACHEHTPSEDADGTDDTAAADHGAGAGAGVGIGAGAGAGVVDGGATQTQRSSTNHSATFPVHEAAKLGRAAVLQELIKNGADVDRGDNTGQTPLHLAFQNGEQVISEILLKAGANMKQGDANGSTPLHYVFAAIHYQEKLRVDLQLDEAVLTAQSPPTDQQAALLLAAEAAFGSAMGAEASGDGGEQGEGEGHIEPLASPLHVSGRQGSTRNLAKALSRDRWQSTIQRLRRHVIHKHNASPPEWVLEQTTGHTVAPTAAELARAEEVALRRVKLDAHECDRMLSNLNVVVDTAIRYGADLDARDDSNQKPMSEFVMRRWYAKQEELLRKEAWTNVAAGFKSHLFQDPRTQMTVDFMWARNVRGHVYRQLCVWSVFVGLVMLVAIWQTGRGLYYTRTFQTAFEESILFDEYGAHHSGFWDMRNEAELFEWLEEILTPNLFENRGKYRDGAPNATDQVSTASVNHFSHLIGRPRIRTIRSVLSNCTGVDGNDITGFSAMACMEDASDVDTSDFWTGDVLWKYKEPDVPAFGGLVDTYSGGGHSMLIPESHDEWLHILQMMKDHSWVDMQTRFVVVELSLFNPSGNLFLTARLGVEMPTTGAVMPIPLVDTLKLIHFVDANDDQRFPIEVIAFLGMIVYIWLEIGEMTAPWPDMGEDGDDLVPRLHLHVPMLENCESIFRSCMCRAHKAPKKRQVTPAAEKPTNVRHFAAASGKVLSERMALGADTLRSTTTFLCCNKITIRRVNTGIKYRPYFVDTFNLLDMALIPSFVALMWVSLDALMEADELRWETGNHFVNTFHLGNTVRQKVYLMAVCTFLVWFKMLEFLRVNRDLSTFILVIKGMLGRISSFLYVLLVCVVAFASLQYVAFGYQSDDTATVLLGIIGTYNGAMGEVDLLQHFHLSRYVAPLFAIAMSVFMVIVMMNLLIAVMSEGYEDIKEAAAAAWCFTQFKMLDTRLRLEEERRQESWYSPTKICSCFRNACCCCADSCRRQRHRLPRSVRSIGGARTLATGPRAGGHGGPPATPQKPRGLPRSRSREASDEAFPNPGVDAETPARAV